MQHTVWFLLWLKVMSQSVKEQSLYVLPDAFQAQFQNGLR